MTNLLKQINQYQINLEKIYKYEKDISAENRTIGYYVLGGQPKTDRAKGLFSEKLRLEQENRNIVLETVAFLENNSASELEQIRNYTRSWLHTTQENPEKPLSLLEAVKATLKQNNTEIFSAEIVLDYKLSSLSREAYREQRDSKFDLARLRYENESKQDLIDQLEKNNCKQFQKINKLESKIAKITRNKNYQLNQTENEKKHYLAELNNLDQDFQLLENLLADKNTKLAQAIQEKKNLQQIFDKKANKLNRIEQKLKRTKKYYKQEKKLLKTQLTYYEDQDEKLRNTIQDLQNQINNHTFSPLLTCSHEDYNELKTELTKTSKEREEVIQKKLNQKKEIVKLFVNEFSLNQEQNNTIEQIINTIKNLLDKPPIEREIERIQESEKELQEKTTPFGENLATIKQLELNSLEHLFKKEIDTNVIQQIQQATSYQQVVAARQSFLEKHLNKKEQEVKPIESVSSELVPVNKERIVLLSLLVMSLGIIIFTIIAKASKKKRER